MKRTQVKVEGWFIGAYVKEPAMFAETVESFHFRCLAKLYCFFINIQPPIGGIWHKASIIGENNGQ